MRKLLVILMLLPLSGCLAHVNYYQAPADPGDRYSKVIIRNDSAQLLLDVALYQDPVACKHMIYQRQPIYPGKNLEILAEKGKPFTVMGTLYEITPTGMGRYCRRAATFSPQENKYTFDYT